MSRCCVAHLTHMLQTSSSTKRMFQLLQTIFSFPAWRGESIASTHCFIKSIGSTSHYFIVALKILREILSFTRSFMINTLPLVGCLENSDRNVKQFRVIRGLLQLVLFTVSRYNILSECVWFCNVTPDLYRETVTQQTLLLILR